jgi:heme-degrading monooxygenase HmoA
MIARTWSARTTSEQAPKYAAHLREQVIPGIRGIDGYRGATLLQRDADGHVEMTVITYWRSLDAIRAFAGSDLERAVVADEAAALLTDFDRRVTHWQVVAEDLAP